MQIFGNVRALVLSLGYVCYLLAYLLGLKKAESFQNNFDASRREIALSNLIFRPFWKSGQAFRKAIPGFAPNVYIKFMGLEPHQDPTLHFLRNSKPDGPWMKRVITSKQDLNSTESKLRVALHIHVYYPELLSPILQALNTNRARPDLFLTHFGGTNQSQVEQAISAYSGVAKSIILKTNIGRDLGPFFTHLPESFFSDYEVVGHLHTKKSEDHRQMEGVKGWFEFCVGNLLGTKSSPGMLDHTLSAFASNQKLGIVYPDDPHIIGWSANYKHAVELVGGEHLPDESEMFDFPIGSFFLVRPRALEPLLKLELRDENYPVEPIPYDGTTLHALERLIGIVPRQAGFETAVTYVSSLYR